MLRRRLITALWGIPLLIAIVWLGEPWFTIFVILLGMLAIFEFYRLVSTSKGSPLTYFGLAWTSLLILSRNPDLLASVERHLDPSLLAPLLFASAAILSLIWFLIRRRKEGAFADWVWTIAGIVYAGWLLGYLVSLRALDGSREWGNWVFLALFCTFASDTAAFFVGRAIGKHPLAPRISPGKTREGAIAGIFGAILVSLFFVLPTPLGLSAYLNWAQAILLGILVSIFGQFGDLVESLFKRTVGVKDSGKLLPGHGGILDRMDSIVFAGVVVYYYVVWVIL